MSDYQKAMRLIMVSIFLIIIGSVLVACESTNEVLAGATHARGHVSVDGFFTDSTAEADLCKVPAEYTPEQAIKYCSAE